MSENGSVISEKEVETANLFSRLHYFTKCHIQIFPVDLKNKMSDIDVFAVKFDRHLNPDVRLIEVKEGYGKVTELFQLFGFKTYFQPCTAYLVAKEIHETTLQTAKKLHVYATTHDRLKEIVEKDLGVMKEKEESFLALKVSDVDEIDQSLFLVKKSDGELFWKYHYLWLETNPYERFYHLQSLFAKAVEIEKGINDIDLTKALEWYKQELFCLSLLSAISIAHDCMDLNQTDIPHFIEDRFYNVGTSKEGKLKVKRGIETLTEQVRKLSKDTIKITPIEVIPSYVNDLIDLVQFLIDNAPYVQSYLLVDDSVQRASLKRTPKSYREFTRAGIQAKRIEEMNKLLLMVLYERRPLEITFQNFI